MEELVRIVSAADGQLVGRTRLQKTVYLLELAGLGSGYHFGHRFHGPYSEELASAADIAPRHLDLQEERKKSDWGGTHSVFTSGARYEGDDKGVYRQLVSIAKQASSVVLDLAATAAYLAKRNHKDPWGETARRKAAYAANGRLDEARELYGRFKKLRLPVELPDI